ncbi:DEAD/DEAH box helicase [Polycladidibacter stylochi]|uniref:DEAD/DEAH box helicase n=1 Tax=Polycladidibacter stylochi TaxID=1807766 RepID=UPI0008349B4C|nr:DEAD/DEAH box helicase [Pseudovibrio stylochi]
MKAFTEAGLATPILRAVTEQGYQKPTPIQQHVIPALLENKDILGIAQTGTGKTAAFVLPILQKLVVSGEVPEAKHCSALILVPTRELANQVKENIDNYSKYLEISSTVILGGVKPNPQIRAMAPGLDIIIATPGRLEDHMRNEAVSLAKTSMVVLDEADQMLDLGFAPAIRRILKAVAPERQTILLSATMPTQIRRLAKEFLSQPEEISVAPASKPIERIEQSVAMVNSSGKRQKLVEILKDLTIERAIVFTRTKRGADRVSQQLVKAGFDAAAIHGNKSQRQRENVLNAFRGEGCNILVATDVAARGIDIPGVSHVINYELPNVPEAYVHRIGRTARAGKSGVAISLCDPSEHEYLRDIEKLIGQKLKSGVYDDCEPLPGGAFDPVTAASRGKNNATRRARQSPSGSKPSSGRSYKKAPVKSNSPQEKQASTSKTTQGRKPSFKQAGKTAGNSNNNSANKSKTNADTGVKAKTSRATRNKVERPAKGTRRASSSRRATGNRQRRP